MTEEQLQQLKISPEWLEPLTEACEKFDINTPARQAAFLGQCLHESGGFQHLQENLNYSAEGLERVWPSRFSHATSGEYARKPEAIANKVYADRNGNGPEASGEGWKYRGRGLIQLTGKDAYRRAGDALGVDLVADPDLVVQPRYAALTAAWFWKARGLNELADAREYEAMTKKINGGTLGLQDRIARIDQAMEVLA